jgi:hypothetical protein
LIFFAIAGCSGGTTNPMPDASVTNDMSANGDMANGGNPDMAVVITGTKIASGPIQVLGATDDNFVIYNDITSGNVTVADFMGKNPTALGLFNDAADANGLRPILTSHNVAFVWHDGDMNNNGPLTVWTQAGGKKDLSQMASYWDAVASPDSKYIAYFDNWNGDVLADLTVAQSDGSNVKVLAKQVSVDPQNCGTAIAFVAGKLVAAHCDPTVDGGTANATVTSYDPATGMGTDLATDMNAYLHPDVARLNVLAATSANVGQVFNVMTGMKSAVSITDLSDGFFSSDGSQVIYNTMAGALDSIPTAGGSPTVLQANNVTAWQAFSDDRKWVLYSSDFDTQTGLVDLYLAPTDKAAAPVTLVATKTAATGGVWGDSFTSDSSTALYFTNVASDGTNGDLSIVSVAAGTPKMIASKVWTADAAGGAKIVYNDNYVPDQNTAGFADLEVLDVSKGTTPTTVATQANVDFVVSSDHKVAIYSTGADKTREGMYVFSIP